MSPRGFRRFAAGFLDDCGERGAIMLVAAIALTIVVVAAALAVDVGGRVQETRQEQAVADLAALDAARDLTQARSLAVASALHNGVDASKPGYSVVAVTGTMTNGTFTPNTVTPNAVQLTVSTPYNDFFGGGSSRRNRSSIAQASLPSQTKGQAQFWIGSKLVDIQAGLGRFGYTSLTLVGYNGLAGDSVTLSALKTALGIGAATPDALLASSVTVAQLVNASASLLNPTNPTAATDLTTLGSHITGSFNSANTVTIGQALGLRTGQGTAFSTQVNLLQMITGSIDVANQKAGLVVNNVGVGLPGVAGANVSFAGITPPSISPLGPVGVSASNTQVTTTATVVLNVNIAGIGLTLVTLPLNGTLGGATGTVTAIDCSGITPMDLVLSSLFKDVQFAIGAGTIQLAALTIGSVSGNVGVAGSTVNGTVVNNPANFVPNQAPVSVHSSLGAVDTSGLTTTLGSVAALAIDAVLTPVLPSIVTQIMSSLGSSYGIWLGNADYLGIQQFCQSVQLVK